MRYPHAAHQLESEVKAAFPDATLEPIDEGDGFGVHRRFRFDKDNSDRVKAVLDNLDDYRLVSVENTAHGLVVEFPATRHADDRTAFGVASIHEALADVSDAPPDPKSAKKAAAKRASAKDD